LTHFTTSFAQSVPPCRYSQHHRVNGVQSPTLHLCNGVWLIVAPNQVSLTEPVLRVFSTPLLSVKVR